MKLCDSLPESSKTKCLGDEDIIIKTKSKGNLSPEQREQVRIVLGLANYQNITLKTRGIADVYFEREHILKIKK